MDACQLVPQTSAALLPDPTLPWEVDPQPNSLARELGVRPLPRPGCAFRYRGRYLYFATEMQTVVEIDEASFLCITALLVGRSLQQAWHLTQRRGVRITPDEIRQRLVAFRDAGLFASPPEGRLRADIDQTVDVLMRNQPMKIMLFMAESCNLRCTYCYGIEGNYEDKGEKMSPELASTAVDYLFARSPARPHYYIYFFGGEPLINLPTIEHTVRYAKERARAVGKTVEFGLTTNGTLLSDRAVGMLIEHDFQVCVSLDGTPEKHDRNRPTKGGGGSFGRALEGYRRLMAKSRRSNQVKVRATMSHQNHDPLEIADYFESIGIKKYGIGTTFERNGNPQATDVLPEDLLEMERSFDRLLDQLLERIEKDQPLPLYNPFFKTVGSLTTGARRPFIGCGVCRNDQGIGTDGLIYPCHRYVGLKEYVIGDIRTGLDREKTRRVYEQFFAMWERHCKQCWARYTCSGACMWQHSHDDGEIRDPLPYQCQSIRRSVQRSAWFTVELAKTKPQILEAISRTHVAKGGCCQPQ